MSSFAINDKQKLPPNINDSLLYQQGNLPTGSYKSTSFNSLPFLQIEDWNAIDLHTIYDFSQGNSKMESDYYRNRN